MVLMVEIRIRGAMCHSNNWYTKANNIYVYINLPWLNL